MASRVFSCWRRVALREANRLANPVKAVVGDLAIGLEYEASNTQSGLRNDRAHERGRGAGNIDVVAGAMRHTNPIVSRQPRLVLGLLWRVVRRRHWAADYQAGGG